MHPAIVQLVQKAASEEYQTAARSLKTESPDRCRRTSQRRMDAVLVAHTGREGVACRAGCHFCCHLRVVATAPEVLGMVDYLRSTLPVEEVDVLKQRVDAAVERGEWAEQARSRADRACPLLIDGRCSAYSARPMMCRNYHSTSAEQCRSLHEHPAPDQPIHFLLVRKAVGEHHVRAWRAALRENGYDANDYELCRALQEALRSDEPRRRFENRLPAFVVEAEPAPVEDGR